MPNGLKGAHGEEKDCVIEAGYGVEQCMALCRGRRSEAPRGRPRVPSARAAEGAEGSAAEAADEFILELLQDGPAQMTPIQAREYVANMRRD